MVDGPGRIGRRQTTYWVLHPDAGPPVRAHFTGKREVCFTDARYDEAALLDAHPLLIDYGEPWSALYVGGAPAPVEATLTLVAARVEALTDGWRAAEHYLSRAAARVLTDGAGLLLRAPSRLVDDVAAALAAEGVGTSSVAFVGPAGGARLLLLGRSFIVADHFRFEPDAP